MRTSVLCSVISGELPLTISWYKNLSPLSSIHSDVEIVSLGEFTSNLKITNVQRVHAGNYTCQAKNNLRGTSASYSAQMVVQGKRCLLCAACVLSICHLTRVVYDFIIFTTVHSYSQQRQLLLQSTCVAFTCNSFLMGTSVSTLSFFSHSPLHSPLGQK